MTRLKLLLTLGTAMPALMVGGLAAHAASAENARPVLLAQADQQQLTPEQRAERLKKRKAAEQAQQQQGGQPPAPNAAAPANGQQQRAAPGAAAGTPDAPGAQQQKMQELQKKRAEQKAAQQAKEEERRQKVEERAQQLKAQQQKAADQKAAQQKAAQEKAAQQKAAQDKAAQEAAARKKAEQQKAAEQKAQQQQQQKAAEQPPKKRPQPDQGEVVDRSSGKPAPQNAQQPPVPNGQNAPQAPTPGQNAGQPPQNGQQAGDRERQDQKMRERIERQQQQNAGEQPGRQPPQAPAGQQQPPQQGQAGQQPPAPTAGQPDQQRAGDQNGGRNGDRNRDGDRNWNRDRNGGRDQARELPDNERRWTREEGRRMKQRPDFDAPPDARRVKQDSDRVIFDLGSGDIVVRHDETRRLRHDARDVYYDQLPNGYVRTTIERPGGVRIVTVEDQYGNVVERTRVLPNGREIVLFAAPRDYVRQEDRHRWRDPAVDLPPIQVTMPRDQYVLEADQASRSDFYRTLDAPPVEQLDRTYSLEDVRYSERLRDMMPRVDLDSINFETGSAQITRSEVDKLSDLAYAMQQMLDNDPGETFLIEGHTDAVGSDNANLALSDRRAESVASALTDVYDIPPENLVTQGYGEQYLKVDTEGASRANRRVTVRRITPLVNPVAQAN